MLIRLLSDMHLEFGGDWEHTLPKMPEDSETVLAVPGDINTGTDACGDFLTEMSSRFKHVLYVLGNHEFYHNDLDTLASEIRHELEDFPNVTLLDRDTVVLDGVRFIGVTLWTDMERENPLTMMRVQRCLNDYGFIYRNFKPVFATDTVALHKEDVQYLEDKLACSHDGPTVVLTHHGPSFLSVHPLYQRGEAALINGGFHSDLDWLMEKYPIDYWLHGHTHNTMEYEQFGTKVRMNPVGYGNPSNPENIDFNPNFRIEL